jgi:hypothetical protein
MTFGVCSIFVPFIGAILGVIGLVCGAPVWIPCVICCQFPYALAFGGVNELLYIYSCPPII